MTLRIDTTREGRQATLRLIGRIGSQNLDELKRQLAACGGTAVLDLDEVTLVDREVIRFLKTSEREGVELRNCRPYIREWIARERDAQEG
jgi:hypothetical protein